MKTTKKILVTFLAMISISIISSSTVFAAEQDPVGTISAQGAVTEDTSSTNDTANINNTDDNGQRQTDGTAENNKVKVNEDGSYIDAQGQLWVIDYVDEQGQVFYKEAEKSVAEKITEVKEDTEKVKAEAEKDKKTEKPAVKKPSYSEKDLRLLACLVYSEAGNQSYSGMLGVANVVINRTHSSAYYYIHTIKEAIYDRKWSVQFAVTIKNSNGVSILDKALKSYDTGKFAGSNPKAEKKAMDLAIKAAKAALQGKNNIGDLLCFQNVRSSKSIKKKYSDYKIIGDHIFYRADK